MALLRCVDCGHKVSDQAFACPECARPVAAMPEMKASAAGHSSARVAVVRPSEGRGSAAAASPTGGLPLPPAAAQLREQIRLVTAPPATAKLCLHCGAD